MPYYDYKCLRCGEQEQKFVAIRLRDITVFPCKCGGRLKRQFSPTRAVQVFKPYYHPNLDSQPVYIKTKRQEVEEFKRRNLIDGR